MFNKDYLALSSAELDRADDVAMDANYRKEQIERCYIRAEIYALQAIAAALHEIRNAGQ